MRYLLSAPLVDANYVGQFLQNPEFLRQLAEHLNDACLWDNERHLFRTLDTDFYIRPTEDNRFLLAIESGPDAYVECVEYSLEEVHAFLLMGEPPEYEGLV